MGSERIDVYDENLKHLGEMSRDEAHQSGSWHRTIHCWVVRPTEPGFVLFQKRGREKDLFPNTLDITAAGHYTAGESPQDGVREILEELGIHVEFEELTALGLKVDLAKIGNVTNREFCDVFLLERSDEPSAYSLDPEEVEGLVQMPIPGGLRLFAGDAETAPASGVEWDKPTNSWKQIEIDVKFSDFIPRIDPYYRKIFIMADLMRKGYPYLSI